MSPAFSLLFVALTMIGQPSGEGHSHDQAINKSSTDVRCGSYSLYVALKATGFDPGPFETMEKSLGLPGPLGYSMLQLKEQAIRCGADALAVETNLENLLARPKPFACIALLKDDHFVVLYDVADARAYLIDNSREVDLPIDTFLARWTKKSLLISPTPLAAEESIGSGKTRRTLIYLLFVGLFVAISLFGLGFFRWKSRTLSKDISSPGILAALLLSFSCQGCRNDQPIATAPRIHKSPSLIVEPSFHALGNIPLNQSGEIIEVSTTLRNVGSDPLTIRKILTSCSCTVPKPPDSYIPAGESIILKTRISLGRATEARRTNITIYSSDPNNPATKVEFEGRTLNPLVATPPAYRIAKLKPGTTAMGKIRLSPDWHRFLRPLPFVGNLRFPTDQSKHESSRGYNNSNSPSRSCCFFAGVV